MLSGKTCAEPIPQQRSARRIASWNSQRDCWEGDQVDLLSGRLDVFSETFPISGSMRNGVVYEHQTLGHHTIDSGSLSSQNGELLKTPTAQLAINGGSQHPDKRKAGGHGPTLADEVEHLLPTPRTTDGTNSMTAPSAMRHAEAGMGSLPEVIGYRDLELSRWGSYAAAIQRWESVLGRPAPEPTEVGPKGGRRLSARFVEWMMGLPEGWVTDEALGLSRVQQLKMLGNGVVTQQALLALALAGWKETA